MSGLADKEKYPALIKVLKQNEHASPYMEKYVIEALFRMGENYYGMERMKRRFAEMVNDSEHTTLYEGGLVLMDSPVVLPIMPGVAAVLLSCRNMCAV